MKQLFMFCIFTLLFAIGVSAQDSYEYPYNPIMAMSGDGNIIAISGRTISDSTASRGFLVPVDFYDATTGDLIGLFIGNHDTNGFIVGLDLNYDGSLLAYRNDYGRLGIVDVATGEEINIIDAGGVIAGAAPLMSPDDAIVADPSRSSIDFFQVLPPLNYLGSFSDDSTTEIIGIDWSEDGNFIVYSSINAETSEGVLLVLEVLPNNEFELVKAMPAPAATTISVNDDASAVAINKHDGVLVINIEDETKFLLPKIDLENPIFSLDWSSDGERLVVGGFKTVDIWNLETAIITQTIETESIVYSVFFSPNDEYIYHTGGLAGIYRDGISLREAIANEENASD
jgi:hypothetical protein